MKSQNSAGKEVWMDEQAIPATCEDERARSWTWWLSLRKVLLIDLLLFPILSNHKRGQFSAKTSAHVARPPGPNVRCDRIIPKARDGRVTWRVCEWGCRGGREHGESALETSVMVVVGTLLAAGCDTFRVHSVFVFGRLS